MKHIEWARVEGVYVVVKTREGEVVREQSVTAMLMLELLEELRVEKEGNVELLRRLQGRRGM